MAFDPGRGRVVLFGGNGVSAGNDLWEWDGVNWLQRTPANPPSVRWDVALAPDWDRRTVILDGGYHAGFGLRDTWEWDGVAGTWQQLQASGAPGNRFSHAMAYDTARGVFVVFGPGTPTTWELKVTGDGTARWRLRTPAVTPPAGTPVMGYDAASGHILLLGGSPLSPGLASTWMWDGAAGTWTDVSTAPSPAVRNYVSGAYDSDARRLVVFGGEGFGGSGNILGDTWERDTVAGTWAQRSPPFAPAARLGTMMAYDAALHKCLMFSGQPSNGAALADTWVWDGQSWSQLSPLTSPPPRIYGAMAYDPVRQRAVLFGGVGNGYRNDTWEWNSSTLNWEQRQPAHVPAAREGPAMTFDAARGRIVMIGGAASSGALFADVWEFDGVDWQLRIVPQPPPGRELHQIAYDPARQRILMFSGFGSQWLDDTWEWDSLAGVWTDRTPAISPTTRDSFGMVFDAARGRTIMFGGYLSGALGNDLWEWDADAGAWHQLPSLSSPTPRSQFGMAYDISRDRIVMFSGQGGREQTGDTWELGCSCYANCDGSSTAPVLNVNDFLCFQARFAAGDSYANCDGSTAPPVLNVNDFVCFQQRFAAGCA